MAEGFQEAILGKNIAGSEGRGPPGAHVAARVGDAQLGRQEHGAGKSRCLPLPRPLGQNRLQVTVAGTGHAAAEHDGVDIIGHDNVAQGNPEPGANIGDDLLRDGVAGRRRIVDGLGIERLAGGQAGRLHRR